MAIRGILFRGPPICSACVVRAKRVNEVTTDLEANNSKTTYFAVNGRLDGFSRVHGQVWIAATATMERVLVLLTGLDGLVVAGKVFIAHTVQVGIGQANCAYSLASNQNALDCIYGQSGTGAYLSSSSRCFISRSSSCILSMADSRFR